MLVRELKELLENPDMQERNLNVKLTNNNPGGNGRVTICQVLNLMNRRFEDVMTAITALSDRVNYLETNINTRLDKIEARIDNLVAKNHLEE